jgi:hypothetical protein
MHSVSEAVRRCDPRLRRLAGRRRPGFSLDELDGVARGIAEIDRAPARIPANLALDLDPSLAKGGRERIEGARRDREGDMPGPMRTMGRDAAAWARRTLRVEYEKHASVGEPERSAQLVRLFEWTKIQDLLVEPRRLDWVGGIEHRLVDTDDTGAGQWRGVNLSQVAEPRIIPRTKLQPPSAIGGNMYTQWSQRTSACGAVR